MDNLQSAPSIMKMIKEVSDFYAAADVLGLDFETVANLIDKRKAKAEADDYFEQIIMMMMINEQIARDMATDR